MENGEWKMEKVDKGKSGKEPALSLPKGKKEKGFLFPIPLFLFHFLLSIFHLPFSPFHLPFAAVSTEEDSGE